MRELLESKTNLKAVVVTSLVNILVWYGYSLLGTAAPQIGDAFFPSNNAQESLLNVFLLFAAGYLVRPLGGIAFGIIGDKLGRKVALGASIILMSSPTFIIGILPGYTKLGSLSATIIFIARLMQGIAIGGALTSALSFTIEHVTNKHRGFAGSLSMAGICIGIFLGSLISSSVNSVVTCECYNSWGWRIPFLLAILMVPIAFYIIRYLDETPEFEQNQKAHLIQEHPLSYVLANYKSNVLISIFLNAAGSIVFYFQVVYIPTYLHVQRDFDDGLINILVNCTYLVMGLAALFGGYLSDIWDKIKMFRVILILLCVLIFPMMHMFNSAHFSYIIFAHLTLSILAAFYIAVEQALQCQIYPSHIRNTGLSISYNLATTAFGGTTPYVMQKAHSLDVGATYITVTVLFSLIALFYFRRLMIKE